MQRNTLVTLAVVATLVLAGCMGGGTSTTTTEAGPSDQTTATTTEQAVQSETDTTQTTASDSTPATTASGEPTESLTVTQDVFDNHTAALKNKGSFTVKASLSATRTNPDRAKNLETEVTLNADFENQWVYSTIDATRDSQSQTINSFMNASGEVYQRVKAGGNTEYRTFPTEVDSPSETSLSHLTYMKGATLTKVGTETVDGVTVEKYTASSVEALPSTSLRTFNQKAAQSFESSVGTSNPTVTEFSAMILIDENGIIRGFEVTMTVKGDEYKTTQTMSGTFTNLGETSVDKPDWVPKAVEAGNPYA